MNKSVPVFLDPRPLGKLKTLALDYYNFINLGLYFAIICPLVALCYGCDRLFRTRCVDAVIRFCELF
jgi:hypothetical protein